MNSISEKDIGRWVQYTPTGEKGRIKSLNEKWVFVVFKCAGEWDNYQDYTGAATKPEDLILIVDDGALV